MEVEKEQEIQELMEEIEIILSIKDDISKEEIENFQSKFSLLSEHDIRKKIWEITKNDMYITELKYKDENHNNEEIYIEKKEKINQMNLEHEYKKITNEETKNEEIKSDDKDINVELEEDKNHNYHIETYDANENIPQQNKPINEIIDETNIPEVSFVKAEIKYGQLSLEWGWNEKIDKVLICYRMDKFPTGPKDAAAFQLVVTKEDNSETGNYIINKVNEGNYYFSIYVISNCNEKNFFSKAQRRLVANKEPSEIFYEMKIKKNILGKVKNVEIVLSTDEKEINLPQLVLIGKFGNIPIQKSDGECILNIDYDVVTNDDLISFQVPIENLTKNMYVKLFFVDDSNSKLYRIISPSKENLHFK
jgi:hypothetical protein